jgi:hypothetical protein
MYQPFTSGSNSHGLLTGNAGLNVPTIHPLFVCVPRKKLGKHIASRVVEGLSRPVVAGNPSSKVAERVAGKAQGSIDRKRQAAADPEKYWHNRAIVGHGRRGHQHALWQDAQTRQIATPVALSQIDSPWCFWSWRFPYFSGEGWRDPQGTGCA